jgi:hypothetical protein
MCTYTETMASGHSDRIYVRSESKNNQIPKLKQMRKSRKHAKKIGHFYFKIIFLIVSQQYSGSTEISNSGLTCSRTITFEYIVDRLFLFC